MNDQPKRPYSGPVLGLLKAASTLKATPTRLFWSF